VNELKIRNDNFNYIYLNTITKLLDVSNLNTLTVQSSILDITDSNNKNHKLIILDTSN
jgi:hypothetical protein